MSSADLSFALNDLAGWSRRHGIHQARAVLGFAAAEAADCADSEALANLLEERAHDVAKTGGLPVSLAGGQAAAQQPASGSLAQADKAAPETAPPLSVPSPKSQKEESSP